MRNTTMAIAISTLGLMLAGCSKEPQATAPTPEPTYASAKEADGAVPEALRAEYQHMLECEMKAMAAKGKEPELDTATVVRLTKAVKAGQTAPPGC